MNEQKAPSIYFEIGKTLALQLAETYASVDPRVGVAVDVAKLILEQQQRVAKQTSILAQAQAEGWTEDDARWDAPLAAQRAEFDAAHAEHDRLVAQRKQS